MNEDFKTQITYQDFEDEIAEQRVELEKAYAEKDYLKTISYLRSLCRFYYYLTYKLADDRLEEITAGVAKELLGEVHIEDSDPNTVVFYDGPGILDRYVAEVYTTGLAQAGFNVVVMMHANKPGVGSIQLRYAGWKNVSFRIIPRSGVTERMKHIQSIIAEVKPRHILIQNEPWDVCGMGAISTIRGNVTRYLIDQGDHAFWLSIWS